MIDHKTLMIGDLVIYHGGEEGDMLCEIDAVDIVSMERSDYRANHSPIVLTVEITKTLQAADKEVNQEGLMLQWIQKNESFTVLTKVDLTENLYIHHAEDTIFLCMDLNDNSSLVLMEAHYLHQLQQFFRLVFRKDLPVDKNEIKKNISVKT